MVADPRATVRTAGLRPLGLPHPLVVQTDADREPIEVGGVPVTEVQEIWRIAEEWWRAVPLERTYYRLLLADDRLVTCFRDQTDTDLGADPEGDLGGGWFEQRY